MTVLDSPDVIRKEAKGYDDLLRCFKLKDKGALTNVLEVCGSKALLVTEHEVMTAFATGDDSVQMRTRMVKLQPSLKKMRRQQPSCYFGCTTKRFVRQCTKLYLRERLRKTWRKRFFMSFGGKKTT